MQSTSGESCFYTFFLLSTFVDSYFYAFFVFLHSLIVIFMLFLCFYIRWQPFLCIFHAVGIQRMPLAWIYHPLVADCWLQFVLRCLNFILKKDKLHLLLQFPPTVLAFAVDIEQIEGVSQTNFQTDWLWFNVANEVGSCNASIFVGHKKVDIALFDVFCAILIT